MSHRLGSESGAAFEVLQLLLLVWAGLLLVAALPPGARVLGQELVQSELTELWREEPRPVQPRVEQLTPPSVLATGTPDAGAPRAEDGPPERLLIVGDSMLDGLLPRLADYAVENGHSLNAVIWYGSRTIDWARTTHLRDALRDYDPSYVMLVIGSSELSTRDIEKRADAVRRILSTVGERKLVWVGPPNWRVDTGLGALLEREVGSARFFRSSELSFERKRDRIHPTLASSQKWMDAIASWIVTRSAAPMRLSFPSKTGAPRPRARVFAPPSP